MSQLNLHKCAGDSIISQYNKVTERTAAGWNEIIYFDITTEKSYMLSIDDFCVSLEMIEHDCLIYHQTGSQLLLKCLILMT